MIAHIYTPPYWKLFSASSKGGINNKRNLNFLDLEASTVSFALVQAPSARRRAMADFRQLALDFVLEDDEAKLTELAQRAAKGVL